MQQLWTIRADPGMNIGASDAAGRAHVADNCHILAALKQLQSLSAGGRANDLITVSFQSGPQERHHRALVFNNQ